MLEQIPVSDKYKFWIDQVAALFGGLDICSVQAIVDNDGKEFIIDVNDSSFTLLGESQEGDRRLIAELIIDKMSESLQNAAKASGSLDNQKSISTNNNNSTTKRTSVGYSISFSISFCLIFILVIILF